MKKIILMLGIVMVLVAGCNKDISPSLDECVNDFRDGKLDNSWCASEPSRCIVSCEQFNATYFTFDSGGFDSNECWCVKDGNPLQIY